MLLRAPAAGYRPIVVAGDRRGRRPWRATALTLLPDGGVWFGFNVREDALGGLAIGAQVFVAAQARAAPGRVVEMRNWGEFAAWRAARASGDHDLDTFFFPRVDPSGAVAFPCAGANCVAAPASKLVRVMKHRNEAFAPNLVGDLQQLASA